MMRLTTAVVLVLAFASVATAQYSGMTLVARVMDAVTTQGITQPAALQDSTWFQDQVDRRVEEMGGEDGGGVQAFEAWCNHIKVVLGPKPRGCAFPATNDGFPIKDAYIVCIVSGLCDIDDNQFAGCWPNMSLVRKRLWLNDVFGQYKVACQLALGAATCEDEAAAIREDIKTINKRLDAVEKDVKSLKGRVKVLEDRPIAKDGAKGDQGPQGIQGPKGDKGDTGPKGDVGGVGPAGQSVDINQVVSETINQLNQMFAALCLEQKLTLNPELVQKLSAASMLVGGDLTITNVTGDVIISGNTIKAAANAAPQNVAQAVNTLICQHVLQIYAALAQQITDLRAQINAIQLQCGPAGPAGAAGAKGETGVSGAIGPQGGVGPAGPKGDIGPAGADGAAGRMPDHQRCIWGGCIWERIEHPYGWRMDWMPIYCLDGGGGQQQQQQVIINGGSANIAPSPNKLQGSPSFGGVSVEVWRSAGTLVAWHAPNVRCDAPECPTCGPPPDGGVPTPGPGEG